MKDSSGSHVEADVQVTTIGSIDDIADETLRNEAREALEWGVASADEQCWETYHAQGLPPTPRRSPC